MNIKHRPQFDTKQICQIYSEKDGVDVTYVCTTDLNASDVPVDVFYRSSPHPEFGNRYFGLYYHVYRDQVMITGADIVEHLEFGMVENDEGELEYSQSHHDHKVFKNGNMIDGGRQYIRSSRGADVYKIKDGEFYVDYVEKHTETASGTNEQISKDEEQVRVESGNRRVEYYQPGSDPQV